MYFFFTHVLGSWVWFCKIVSILTKVVFCFYFNGLIVDFFFFWQIYFLFFFFSVGIFFYLLEFLLEYFHFYKNSILNVNRLFFSS